MIELCTVRWACYWVIQSSAAITLMCGWTAEVNMVKLRWRVTCSMSARDFNFSRYSSGGRFLSFFHREILVSATPSRSASSYCFSQVSLWKASSDQRGFRAGLLPVRTPRTGLFSGCDELSAYAYPPLIPGQPRSWYAAARQAGVGSFPVPACSFLNGGPGRVSGTPRKAASWPRRSAGR